MVRNHDDPDTRGSRFTFRVGPFPAHAHSCAATFSKIKSPPNMSTLPQLLHFEKPLKTRSQCFHSSQAPFLLLGWHRHPFTYSITVWTSSTFWDFSHHIFIPPFKGNTRPHHKLVQQSCWPTGKFLLHFFNFFHLRSWRYVLKLILPPCSPKSRERTNILIGWWAQWLLKHVQRMKETGWVSSTSLGCGSTSE